MDIFREMKRTGKKIVGFDVVELSPDPKSQHATYLAAKLVYRMLNFAFAEPPAVATSPSTASR
jgi:arginase family enzyme